MNPQLPGLFVERVELTLDRFGQPQVASAGGSVRRLGDIAEFATIDVAFVDRIMFYHYFHFVELLLSAATILFTARPDITIENVYVGTQKWCNSAQNNVQRKLIEAVLRPARIVEALNGANGGCTCSAALLMIDRYHPIECIYNKFLEPSMELLPEPFKLIRQRVWESVGIDGQKASGDRAIYVKRTGRRTLAPDIDAQLLEMFSPIGLEVVDFALMTFEEQVQTACSARFMIGVHGNGLTNALWMPPGSLVFEFFPADFHTYDYQFFAEIAGHAYYGFEGKSAAGYTYTNGARVGVYYGREDAIIDALPWAALRTACARWQRKDAPTSGECG